MSLEQHFDAAFATALALKEKQIQQNYRPIIGVHKWFARRPGSIFRCLLLSEFNGREQVDSSYWRVHKLSGVIADPFMGGGTPIYEANRLGFHVVGTDINPMAYWVVRQALAPLDPQELNRVADEVITELEVDVGELYKTRCLKCDRPADVKYFLWVKTTTCPKCTSKVDLFPGYLLAEAERHPRHVLCCGSCGDLNEYATVPTIEKPKPCRHCGEQVHVEGPAHHRQVDCKVCRTRFPYLVPQPKHPPEHRMWAIEYHCAACKPAHTGRFFKRPDAQDLALVERASRRLAALPKLPIPTDEVPPGDETDRLHRWGYRRYRELFGERQLLGLGLLLRRISKVRKEECRHALLTVFSDFLRYQNMLCRYDTYALKCQDIFSVHGFPVGLVQCENNLLGIPRVGSGAFRHFVEKYVRAKEYCRAPFETLIGKSKKIVYLHGESIEARLTETFPKGRIRQAYLLAASATEAKLHPGSLDGVFTDPPYFDNVQYAELMDFCFVWLRQALRREIPEFQRKTTRTESELTGNITLGRGLDHFTEGLSSVFRHFAAALKPGAPFIFTYHHNDASAYVPLIVAILDAGLDCTATLPAAAEMNASLHIAGTGSSVLDSVFVCRAISDPQKPPSQSRKTALVSATLENDAAQMRAAGLRLSRGDLRCLAAGHIARLTVNALIRSWDSKAPLHSRMSRAQEKLEEISKDVDVDSLVSKLLKAQGVPRHVMKHQTAWLPGF